jgi:hypothetical protein
VAQPLQRLHAAGQPPPHGLQVAGDRPQLVLDPQLDRGLQVAAGQPAGGRAERVGRRPDRPAQVEGDQGHRRQHHHRGTHRQALGRRVGPALAAGGDRLQVGQPAFEVGLLRAQRLELPVGEAVGGHQAGGPCPARLPGRQLPSPRQQPRPVAVGDPVDHRVQRRPRRGQLPHPPEELRRLPLGADLGLVGGRVAGEQVGAPARLDADEASRQLAGAAAELVEAVDGRLQGLAGAGRVPGAEEDGGPPGDDQHSEQRQQDGQLHPQAPHAYLLEACWKSPTEAPRGCSRIRSAAS